jgi:hypothetical protein
MKTQKKKNLFLFRALQPSAVWCYFFCCVKLEASLIFYFSIRFSFKIQPFKEISKQNPTFQFQVCNKLSFLLRFKILYLNCSFQFIFYFFLYLEFLFLFFKIVFIFNCLGIYI